MKQPIFLLLGFMLTLVACTVPDSDKVVDTQICLDKASPDTANACMAKLEGLTTPEAQLMRCSALFIEQGFSDPTRLSQIVDSMKTSGGASGSSNASIVVMTVMAFKKASLTANENYERVKQAITYCQASGSKGLTLLAAISKMSTGVLALAGDGTSAVTEATVKTALCNAKTNDAAAEAVGSAALAAYQTSCLGADAGKNDLFCSQFATATAGDKTTTQVGQQLATTYTSEGGCPP